MSSFAHVGRRSAEVAENLHICTLFYHIYNSMFANKQLEKAFCFSTCCNDKACAKLNFSSTNRCFMRSHFEQAERTFLRRFAERPFHHRISRRCRKLLLFRSIASLLGESNNTVRVLSFEATLYETLQKPGMSTTILQSLERPGACPWSIWLQGREIVLLGGLRPGVSFSQTFTKWSFANKRQHRFRCWVFVQNADLFIWILQTQTPGSCIKKVNGCDGNGARVVRKLVTQWAQPQSSPLQRVDLGR